MSNRILRDNWHQYVFNHRLLCESLGAPVADPVQDALNSLFDSTNRPSVVFYNWIATILAADRPDRLMGWQGGDVTLEHDENDGVPVWVLMSTDIGMGAYYFMDIEGEGPSMGPDYANIPGLTAAFYNDGREAARQILKVLLRLWEG